MAIRPPIRVTLGTATWTAVQLQEEYWTEHCQPMAFFTEDGTAFSYSPFSDGAGAATVPNGRLEIDCVFPSLGDDNGLLMYAQAAAGTPVLAVQTAPNRDRNR